MWSLRAGVFSLACVCCIGTHRSWPQAQSKAQACSGPVKLEPEPKGIASQATVHHKGTSSDDHFPNACFESKQLPFDVVCSRNSLLACFSSDWRDALLDDMISITTSQCSWSDLIQGCPAWQVHRKSNQRQIDFAPGINKVLCSTLWQCDRAVTSLFRPMKPKEIANPFFDRGRTWTSLCGL